MKEKCTIALQNEVRITSSLLLDFDFIILHIFLLPSSSDLTMIDLVKLFCNFVLYPPFFPGLTFCLFNVNTE